MNTEDKKQTHVGGTATERIVARPPLVGIGGDMVACGVCRMLKMSKEDPQHYSDCAWVDLYREVRGV